MALVLPSDNIIEAIHGSVTRVTARADIYMGDAVTPWLLNAPVIDGKVSVDGSRSERRTASLEFENVSGALNSEPGGFWYDKVIKVFRGVETATESWEAQIGEFLIDTIDQPHFPNVVSVNARDRTKTLLTDKFMQATSFPINHPIEEVIRTIAINGGVDPARIDFPLTGKSTGRSFLFDRTTERWKAMSEVASAYNYEVYFRADGELTMTPYKDPANPAVSPAEYTFLTGPTGNLISYTKQTGDARLYNRVVVTGESQGTIPVWAKAENTEPTSPTSFANLGYWKTYFYTSSFITTTQQAQDVADRFLAVHALEQYDVSLDALVVPYLDANIIVEFLDPTAGPADPVRFLFPSFDIPLRLGSMSGTARRVTIVG